MLTGIVLMLTVFPSLLNNSKDFYYKLHCVGGGGDFVRMGVWGFNPNFLGRYTDGLCDFAGPGLGELESLRQNIFSD